MKMKKLINLIIFSLLISNVAKCNRSKVDVSHVVDELKDIVGQLEKENQKKTAEKKDFTAKDDAELLDELEFEAEIEKVLHNGKSQDKDDQLKLEGELDRAIQEDKAVSCKDFRKDCFNKYLTKGCLDKDIRKGCPRTCMTCCADVESKFCKARKPHCHRPGVIRQQLRYYCPKTCGYCGKGRAPPPCINSVFGCCWDKSTPASAPFGSGRENCPACKDKRSSLFCSRFEHFCADFTLDRRAGQQIRSFCPKTCRVCGPNAMCMDDEVQKENCPFYKAAGDCEANKNGMRYWCPKTCGFCKCMYIDSLYTYIALPIPLLLVIELGWQMFPRGAELVENDKPIVQGD